MKSRLVWEQAGERTFVVVLDAGDEAFSAVTDFANKNRLGGASLTALGAFESATVAWFDLRARTYRPIEINQQCEGLTLLGDIAIGDDGKSSLHMHAVLGLEDGSTRGGHFLRGVVRPTLEVTIVEAPTHLRRRKQSGPGLALIRP
jgi:predicted DNA-binding protein with PD1-like motif